MSLICRKNHKDIGYKLYKLHYLTDARSDLDENGHEEGMVRQEDFNADKHVRSVKLFFDRVILMKYKTCYAQQYFSCTMCKIEFKMST